MTSLACIAAMQLAQRAGGDLSEADRLRLEAHVEGCNRCADEVALLASIRARLAAPREPDTAMHARAFERAWKARNLPPRRADAVRGTRAPQLLVPAALCIAAAAAVAFVVHRDPVAPPSPRSAQAPEADQVEPSPPIPVGSTRLAEGEDLEVPGALLLAIRPSTVEVDAGGSTVRIADGAVRFEVEPGRVQPFRVVSDEARVDVLGTIFEVDGADVRVERGRVRVSDPGGANATELRAGEQWAPLAAAAEAVDIQGDAAPSRTTPAVVDARALLARARRHLASGEVAKARALVGQALAARLPPALDAEARTLLAECALVAGDPKEAARRYAEVARAHGDRPAGENALFAAARAAHTSGQQAEARRLFEQYLSRYPNGQFVKEARSRLAQLSSTPNGGRK